jgi:hypothetical protein
MGVAIAGAGGNIELHRSAGLGGFGHAERTVRQCAGGNCSEREFASADHCSLSSWTNHLSGFVGLFLWESSEFDPALEHVGKTHGADLLANICFLIYSGCGGPSTN